MSDVETYEELDAMLTGISIRINISKVMGRLLPTRDHNDRLHSDWPLHLWAVSQMALYY